MEISALDREIIQVEECVKYDIIHSTENNIKYINRAISVSLQQRETIKIGSLIGHFEMCKERGWVSNLANWWFETTTWKIIEHFDQAWFFHVEELCTFRHGAKSAQMSQNSWQHPPKSYKLHYNFCDIFKNGQTYWFSPWLFPNTYSRWVMGSYSCHKTEMFLRVHMVLGDAVKKLETFAWI